jgi:hypothetical protein
MPKVMICVPTAEFARQASFYDHFNLIDKPEGTIVTFVHGQSPARNRNIAVEQALAHKCTHVLFLDDDTVPPVDIVHKLLSHDKDVVSGLYLMRNYPNKPILFANADAQGRCLHYYPPDGEQGLVEIVACGLGAVLINTRVFEALEKPWIRLGELEVDHWCDDIGFFRRVREGGFKLYCDLTCISGHMGNVIIRPNYIDGKWFTSYDTSGEAQVSFPSIKPPVLVGV